MQSAELEILKSKLDALMEANLPSQRTLSIPDLLYHYTDANGLIGMLKSQKIWATHYRFLNDTRELRAGEMVTQEALAEYAALGGSNQSLSYVLGESIRVLHKHRPLSSVAELFVASFSEKGNDLSQWRAYGSDGSGYAIGFEIVPKNGQLAGADACTILKCLYRKRRSVSNRPGVVDNIREILQKTSNVYLDFLDKELMPDATPEDERAIRSAAVTVALRRIVLAALEYKNPRFRAESEWRLCILREPGTMAACSYRSDGKRIVPYVEISFGPGTGINVRKIFVGPGRDVKSRLQAVKWLLESNGISDVDPKPSGIPYRAK